MADSIETPQRLADLPEPITREDEYLKYIADNCVPTNGNTRNSELELPISIENGGTGAITATDARTNLDVYSKSETDNKLNETKPISKGGTGGTSASTARTNLDVYSKTEIHNIFNVKRKPIELDESGDFGIQSYYETSAGVIVGGPMDVSLSSLNMKNCKLIIIVGRRTENSISEPDYPIKTNIIPNNGKYAIVDSIYDSYEFQMCIGDRGLSYKVSDKSISCTRSREMGITLIKAFKVN